MTETTYKVVWLEYCNWCKRRHRVTMRPCPECGVYLTPQPVSKRVYESCRAGSPICDGCEAYREHTNPF